MKDLASAVGLIVGRHSGYTYCVFDSGCRPPLDELMTLTNEAYVADYAAADRAIFKYEKEYLRWLMPEGHFFCTWARSAEGEAAGCLVHVERNFFCHGQWFKAYYGTLFSVSPRHRGRGIGERLIHFALDWAFEARGAELEVGMFDLGQAGRPVHVKSVRSYGRGFDIVGTAPITVWATTGNVAKAVRYEPLRGITRVAAWPGVSRLFQASSSDLAVTPVTPMPPDHDRLASACTMGFGWTGSVPVMYAGNGPSGGTFGFAFGAKERCAIAYHVVTLVKGGEPDGKAGMIQFIDRDTASVASNVVAIRHITARLLTAGCFAVFMLDTGVLPRRALLRARYVPTPRKVAFDISGPRERIESLGSLSAPYFIDMY
jgi:GNAT superfamily N-acetyltransferase